MKILAKFCLRNLLNYKFSPQVKNCLLSLDGIKKFHEIAKYKGNLNFSSIKSANIVFAT